MPDVKVRHPSWLTMNTTRKKLVMDWVAELVARHMTCFDYDGMALQVTPDQIDVDLIPYEEENVQFGSVLVVEICAYDYPTRMSNMSQRLKAIGEGVKELHILGHYDALVRGRQTVSLSFIPIPNGCWVAVD